MSRVMWVAPLPVAAPPGLPGPVRTGDESPCVKSGVAR